VDEVSARTAFIYQTAVAAKECDDTDLGPFIEYTSHVCPHQLKSMASIKNDTIKPVRLAVEVCQFHLPEQQDDEIEEI
jgi:hypothetical protein